MARHRTGWATSFTVDLMHAGGNPAVIIPIATVLIILIIATHSYRTAFATIVSAGAALAASLLLKNAFRRPRPGPHFALVHAHGWSMPSSDAALTAAAAFAVIASISWSSNSLRLCWSSLVAAGTAVVGASLVYLGAHWTSDVLAGWLVGGAVGQPVGALTRRFSRPPRAKRITRTNRA